MKFIISEYGKVVITIFFGLAGIFLIVYFLFSTTTSNIMNLSEPGLEIGIYREINTLNYSFNVKESKSICLYDDFNPEEDEEGPIYSSYLEDGTDLSTFVVYTGSPDTNTPGEYEIEYYLKFENSIENKTLSLTVEDRNTNSSCPRYMKTCETNADCGSFGSCYAYNSLNSNKNICSYAEPELIEIIIHFDGHDEVDQTYYVEKNMTFKNILLASINEVNELDIPNFAAFEEEIEPGDEPDENLRITSDLKTEIIFNDNLTLYFDENIVTPEDMPTEGGTYTIKGVSE